MQGSKHGRARDLHPSLRVHPLLRNSRTTKEYASLFSDEGMDGSESIAKRLKKTEPKPQRMSSLAVKMVRAGLVSSRSSFLFSTLKSKIPPAVKNHQMNRSVKRSKVHVDSNPGKHRTSRSVNKSDETPSSTIQSQLQNGNAQLDLSIDENGDNRCPVDLLAPLSMSELGKCQTGFSFGCSDSDLQNPCSAMVSSGPISDMDPSDQQLQNLPDSESEPALSIHVNSAGLGSRSEPSSIAFNHMTPDQKKTLILEIARSLSLPPDNIARIATNLL